MDGNEYAASILRRNGNRIESLLEAAEYQETGWLEFKADPFCNKDRPPQWGDVVWHTLKAVVAMANTRGGCIVFGVDDKTLYAETPLMLGRSYLHVAYQSSGILQYGEQLRYIDKALESLSKTDRSDKWLAQAKDLKAQILWDIYADPDQSYCPSAEIPNQIRELVRGAYAIYPSLYQDKDEEAFEYDVSAGRYPSN